jgi:hypothetical protein
MGGLTAVPQSRARSRMPPSRCLAHGNDQERASVRRRLLSARLSHRLRPLGIAGGLVCSTSRFPQRCPKRGANLCRGTTAVLARARGGLDVRDRATADRGVGDRQRRMGSCRCDLRRVALAALLRAAAVALAGEGAGARCATPATSPSAGQVTFRITHCHSRWRIRHDCPPVGRWQPGVDTFESSEHDVDAAAGCSGVGGYGNKGTRVLCSHS